MVCLGSSLVVVLAVSAPDHSDVPVQVPVQSPTPTSSKAPSSAAPVTDGGATNAGGDTTAAPAQGPADGPADDPVPVGPAEARPDDEPAPTLSSERGGDDAKPKLPHRGIVADVRLGTLGCTKSLCKAHDGKPGIRVDGFFGGNILGFVDIGITGGWGSMRANVEPGTNGLLLYGLDITQFPQPVQDMVNLEALVVSEARLDSVQAGLNVRAHFIPRGRVDPYVGAAAGYQLFRARYDTDAGLTRIGFHGLSFPLQAGFLVFAHPNIAVGAQFDYILTWYGAVSVRGAAGNFGAPLSRLADQAEMAGVELPGDLPHLWTVGGVVHFRFGG